MRHWVIPDAISDEEIQGYPEGPPLRGQIPRLTGEQTASQPAVGAAAWRQVANWRGNSDRITEPFNIRGAQGRLVYEWTVAADDNY